MPVRWRCRFVGRCNPSGFVDVDDGGNVTTTPKEPLCPPPLCDQLGLPFHTFPEVRQNDDVGGFDVIIGGELRAWTPTVTEATYFARAVVVDCALSFVVKEGRAITPGELARIYETSRLAVTVFEPLKLVDNPS